MKMFFEVDGTTTFNASELKKGNLFIQKYSTNLDLNETFLCSDLKRILSRIRQQFDGIISGPILTPMSGMNRHDVAEMASTFPKLRNISSHKLASCSSNVTDQTMSSVGSETGILYTYLCRGYAPGNIRKTNILETSLEEMFENEKNCTKINQCESRCFSMESHNEPIIKKNNTSNWNKTLMVIAEYLLYIVILILQMRLFAISMSLQNYYMQCSTLSSYGFAIPSIKWPFARRRRVGSALKLMKLVFQESQSSDQTKKQDVFIQYHDSDLKWIDDHLIPFFKNTFQMSFASKEDFQVGSNLIDELRTFILQSKSIILVFSDTFVQDGVCRHVTTTAYSTSPHRIVPLGLKLSHIFRFADSLFGSLIKTNGLIEWSENVDEQEIFWITLKERLLMIRTECSTYEDATDELVGCLTNGSNDDLPNETKRRDMFVYCHDGDCLWTTDTLIPFLENRLEMSVTTREDIFARFNHCRRNFEEFPEERNSRICRFRFIHA